MEILECCSKKNLLVTTKICTISSFKMADPRIYRVGKGWKIFLLVGGIALIALFAWGMSEILQNSKQIWLSVFLLLVMSTMILLITLGVIETFISRVLIDLGTQKISTRGLGGKRELFFTEIVGFRDNENCISIETRKNKNGKIKKIKINNIIQKQGEILAILSELCPYFASLEHTDFHAETQSILQEKSFGRSEEERLAKLKRDKRFAFVLNALAWVLGPWLFFRPHFAVLVALLLLFVVSLLIVKFSGGMIHANEKNNSAHPSLVYALTISALMVGLRAFLDYNIFDYKNVWLPSVSLALLLWVLLLYRSKEFVWKKAEDIFVVFLFALFFFFYSYGMTIIFNCQADTSDARVYYADVIDKAIKRSKTNSYYVKLSPWRGEKKPRPESKEVYVNADFYMRVQIGEQVQIRLYQGRLRIPWFTLAKVSAE